jgi:hypothetical protein
LLVFAGIDALVEVQTLIYDANFGYGLLLLDDAALEAAVRVVS